eukprot:CAMPEP_0184874126 /NCGR_PEP_ID=MMETSP0580-20130426/42221_1 /TAXON_ID=1118495 /ORGANISM="Dactyliosolen fragilissimus" /LENGTH=389 /DNA_ID=CAMNT_0027377101 /DNA_START=112 /DNA_END=1281 /DNA_ORIENTATION=+
MIKATSTLSKPLLVFSDVDGTLVHYPSLSKEEEGNGNEIYASHRQNIIYLPPSSTGMKGIISSQTLQLCRTIRHRPSTQRETKLILVSGMRTSTLLSRLPYLPRADAYASEAGGRIFYPTNIDSKRISKELKDSKEDYIVIHPVPYQGAHDDDLAPYALKEDMEWRNRMSKIDAAGVDGYVQVTKGDFGGNNGMLVKKKELLSPLVSIDDRKGALWDLARDLISRGYILDTKGYSTCFRVNIKHQDTSKIGEKDMQRLRDLNVKENGLASSVNLGCIDFYPLGSGKKNCCSYLARKFLSTNLEGGDDGNDESFLSQNALCLCDDDNDLEMASACSKAFVPGLTSDSMRLAARLHNDHIIVTEDLKEGITESLATEKALGLAIEELDNMQ